MQVFQAEHLDSSTSPTLFIYQFVFPSKPCSVMVQVAFCPGTSPARPSSLHTLGWSRAREGGNKRSGGSGQGVGKSQYCHQRFQDDRSSAEMVNISSSLSECRCTLPERRSWQFPWEVYQ